MSFSSETLDTAPAKPVSSLRADGYGFRNPGVFFLVLIGFLALALLLQGLSGAYRAEMSGFPDEPAHFTTGLMIRDYIASGMRTPPMGFAESYYLHYPKVALGHWPPVFYVFEAVWLLIFPAAKASALALMAIYTAICATLIARWIAPRFSLAAGCLTGALFILIPIIQEQTQTVMSGILVAIFCFLAATEFARFIDTGSWRPAALFGLYASLGILTKGSVWALILLPPLALIFTRRLRLMLTWQLWLSASVVALLCIPWQVLTLHMADQGWDDAAPNLRFTLTAIQNYSVILWNDLNPAVFLVLAVGIGSTIVWPLLRRAPVDSGTASMLALMIAVFVFNTIVPTSMEPRKMIDGIPGLLVFVPAGLYTISRYLKTHRFSWLSRPAVIAALLGFFFAGVTFLIPPTHSYGFAQAAGWLTANPNLANAAVLISSVVDGEGLMVSETALQERRPGHFVIRADRLLAQVDWNGDNYRPLFPSVPAVRTELDSIPVGVLVVDFRPGSGVFSHHDQLLHMLAMYPHEWTLAGSFHPDGGDVNPVRLYLRTGDLTIRGKIRIDMTRMLHRVLEK